MSTTTLERMTVVAPDISCQHCVSTVTREVGALAGVAEVQVDLPTKRVTVTFDPTRMTREQIEATLAEAGYPVAKQ